jgi:DNA-binding MarR family transcriptional regulator
MTYKLTTSMPYLVARLGVRMGSLFSRRLASYDLTLPMYRVLAALSEKPGQKLGELSAMTTVELSTMSRLIGTMRARRLVSRHRPAGNERAVQIDLTEHGAEMAALLRAEAEHYEEVAVSTLTATEIDVLRRTLIQMFDSLDVLEGELVANAPSRATGNAPASAGAPG